MPSDNPAALIGTIAALVPPGSGEPADPALVARLSGLTSRLVSAMAATGRLDADPLADLSGRTLTVCESVGPAIGGRTVLVTGGEGCLGRRLVAALVAHGARCVVSVDRVMRGGATPAGVQRRAVDVTDPTALAAVFAQFRPQIVFHLAALRHPGLAERAVSETVTTNVLGTATVLALSEATGVERFVFASTGKASRYTTREVYAATKKLAEWQCAASPLACAAVRFTHILDNSLVLGRIARQIRTGAPVSLHTPDRTLVAQTAEEAVRLLLNAVVVATTSRPLPLLAVRHLDWPVGLLEIALWRIRAASRPVPLYFSGLPPGYSEPFFPGQIDWCAPQTTNPLINAFEGQSLSPAPTADTVQAAVLPVDGRLLAAHLDRLRRTPARAPLATAMRALAASALAGVDTGALLAVLLAGSDRRRLAAEGLTLATVHEPVEVLVAALAGRPLPSGREEALRRFLAEAVAVPALARRTAHLRRVLVARETPSPEAPLQKEPVAVGELL